MCRGGQKRVCGKRTFRKPGYVLENNNKMNPYKTGQGRVLDLFGPGYEKMVRFCKYGNILGVP